MTTIMTAMVFTNGLAALTHRSDSDTTGRGENAEPINDGPHGTARNKNDQAKRII